LAPCLGGIAQQQVDFGWTEVLRVELDEGLAGVPIDSLFGFTAAFSAACPSAFIPGNHRQKISSRL
jgi:hypothetical protein